jgi:hypothetical protein
MFFDYTFLLLIPVLILSLWAQFNVKGKFKKYAQVPCSVKMTGAEVAEQILRKNGIMNVKIVETPGTLSDHYNPMKRTVALSPEIYHGRSIAALSVAAHEVGHAIQHARAYYPVVLRGAIVPIANISSQMAFPMIFIGFIFESLALIDVGIYLFAGVLAFHLVTLPVEFNASNRAIAQLADGFIVNDTERKNCRKMLNAAAMTYVASTLMALLQLIRFILLRNARR